MSVVPEPRTARVTADDVKSDFRCGEAALDLFFARYACANDDRGIGRTYVLKRPASAPAAVPRILGYYTLSMTAISAAFVAVATLEKLPKYPLPAALIGRLAADERTRGSGLRVGETLLFDAFVRVLAAAENVGCFGVVVDAKNASAEAFYRQYDFTTVDDSRWPRKMFIALGTVHRMFSGT